MLHTVFDLCFLCIIEAIQSTDKISCDPPDPFKSDSFTDFSTILIHKLIPAS